MKHLPTALRRGSERHFSLLLDETNNEQENHSTDDGVDDCCDNTAARGSPAAPNAKKSAVRGCLGNVRADLPWI
jgi:hypothetical protein